jgi:hypothetical protein
MPPASHDPLGRFAQSLPQSAAGTLFGIPLSLLRDRAFMHRMLFVCAIALLAAAVVPWSLSPLVFGFSDALRFVRFEMFVLPILVGASYLAVVRPPKQIQGKIPPLVQRWLWRPCLAWGAPGSAR